MSRTVGTMCIVDTVVSDFYRRIVGSVAFRYQQNIDFVQI